VAICAVAAFTAALSAGLALRPRLRVGRPSTSPLYFGAVDVNEKTALSYQAALHRLVSDRRELFDEIVEQAWANSMIAHTKYRWAAVSSMATLVALMALGAAAALG
jgi:hypothetical protein